MSQPRSETEVDGAPRVAGPRTRGAWSAQLPARRLLVAAAGWPVLAWVFWSAAGPKPEAPLLWLVLIAATAALASLTLSTYVPLAGTAAKVDVGCEPCARIAGFSVLGAAILLSLSNPSPASAIAPLLLAGFGLGQRVRGATSCPTPTPRVSEDQDA